MNPLLNLILEGESLNTEQMSQILGMSSTEIESELRRLTEEKILLGWRPIINPDHAPERHVRAVIEVKISPEREGGFDRIAERISKFEQVESCYLMSGGYDLLVVVAEPNLRRIASFVFERLATINGVVSTSTHFMLRAYKEQGFLVQIDTNPPDKPAVSP